MSILAFLVARHCDLYCFIVFYYYSCAQVANKIDGDETYIGLAPVPASLYGNSIYSYYCSIQAQRW